MTFSIRCCTALLCSAALYPCPANAQADMTPDGGIIVIGQRDAPIEIAPRGLSVSLGDTQFRGVNATNTEDLMKYAPDFFVRTRFPGDSNGVPGFRGTHSVQSARALVMVDGFVVSNFLGNSFGFAPKWGVVGPSEVRQLDIVYGPYSSRYAGNSMGGIVNITTRDPAGTEAFGRIQLLAQPYDQFATHDTYLGWSGEAGFGLKQKDGPWSLRISGRHFRNDGHPMMFYGLGRGGNVTADPPIVTGAVIDPGQSAATAAGTGLERVPAGMATPLVPGSTANPIFAAQSPAAITQDQAKVKIGYDDGAVTGQILAAYWHNADRQYAPDCYLRGASGNTPCDGVVLLGTTVYTASGANFSRTMRDELLLGGKVAVPVGDAWTGRATLSTYQILRSEGFQSSGYDKGRTGKEGQVTVFGPTGWITGEMSIERKGIAPIDLAFGIAGNQYRTDSSIIALSRWDDRASVTALNSRTFGRTRTLSGWGEAVAHLSSAVTLTAGIRYDNWMAYDGGLRTAARGNAYPTRHADALSPTATVEANIRGGTRLQLSLATATRFPTVGELFQGSLRADGSFNDGFDPTLRPERSMDANALVSHGFGPVRLTGSVFYQRVRDTIFQFFGFTPTGVSFSNYKNIDLTRQYGLEGIVETKDWPVAGMDVEANMAWIDSRTLRNAANRAAENVLFPRIPSWRINGSMRQRIAARLDGAIGVRFASRPNTDLFGYQRGDTYGFTSELFSLDAKLNWQAMDGLRLSAGVNNITNDRAWVFHPYPQRNFLLEAAWTL